MTEVTCVVCFYEAPKKHVDFVYCKKCKDGIVCFDCMCQIDSDDNLLYSCPLCRSIMVEWSVVHILIMALEDMHGIENVNSPLISRWLSQSPIYISSHPGFDYKQLRIGKNGIMEWVLLDNTTIPYINN